MLPSDCMLSLLIACLSHDLFVSLALHSFEPDSNAWLLLNYGFFKAYSPIYFNDDPADRITNILKASFIFDDLVTQPSIYGFDNNNNILVCRDVTPCEQDIDMINPQSIIDTPSLDPQERPVEPRVPHKNCMVIEIPECQKWERIEGQSNNKDAGYSDHEPLEGSSDQEDDEVKTTSQHRQPHCPQPDTQHEEYMRMLQFHRTIDSTPSVIMEAIRQHYQKWEGMSQSSSESTDEHVEDLDYDSLYLSCINTDV